MFINYKTLIDSLFTPFLRGEVIARGFNELDEKDQQEILNLMHILTAYNSTGLETKPD